MSTQEADVTAQSVPERNDAAAAAPEASEQIPALELCERARRAMCMYADLASELIEAAWQRCEGPADVRERVIAAAPWEAWVTRIKVNKENSDMELLMLRHAGCMPGLRHLDASDPYDVERALPSASTCAETLQRCIQLTRIDLSKRKIDEATMVELCVGFTGLSRLRTLIMRGNPLGEGGARWLAEALKHTPALTSLTVVDTSLDGAAMAALAPAFAHLPQLQELNMWDNELGAGGAAALASALSRTAHLKQLMVCCASLDAAAAMAALEPGLSRLARLQVLDVGANAFGPDGVPCLARALRHMPFLKYLYVYDTCIDEAAQVAIRAALPRGCRVMFEVGIAESIA